MAEMPADEFLAAAVVDRGVDQADPAVEHRAQQPAGLLVVNRRPWGRPRSSMAPYPRTVTSAPVRPRGRVWIVIPARYRPAAGAYAVR
jgi:hypothetical protein